MCTQGAFDEALRPGPARLKRRQLYSYPYYQQPLYTPASQMQPITAAAAAPVSYVPQRVHAASASLGSFFDSLTPTNQKGLLQSHFVQGLIHLIFTLFVTLFIATRVVWV